VRIFIISKYLMFREGLKSLLLAHAKVDIIGVAKEVTQAIKQIEILKPDVVVWGTKDRQDNSLGEVLQLLVNKPGLKIISLNLQNNQIIIYQSAKRIAKDIQDLVEIIKGDGMPVS